MEEAELFTSASPLKAQEVQCCAAAWQCRCRDGRLGCSMRRGPAPSPGLASLPLPPLHQSTGLLSLGQLFPKSWLFII